jgi:hypothetical protein
MSTETATMCRIYAQVTHSLLIRFGVLRVEKSTGLLATKLIKSALMPQIISDWAHVGSSGSASRTYI